MFDAFAWVFLFLVFIFSYLNSPRSLLSKTHPNFALRFHFTYAKYFFVKYFVGFLKHPTIHCGENEQTNVVTTINKEIVLCLKIF